MTTFLRDIRLAFRSLLRRNRSLTLISIVSLAFGIGAATSVFSIVNGVLLRPLPYSDPERLVLVTNRWDGEERARLSPAEAFDYQERLRSVASFGFYAADSVTLAGGESPERLRAAFMSRALLPTLGVSPVLGRFFTAEEDFPGERDRVALLSHGLWERRFSGDPSVLGTSIIVDGRPTVVIGVMPASFRHPADLDGDDASALFLPLAIDPAAIQFRGSHFLEGIARLKSGIPIETASAEIARIASGFVRDFPDDYPADLRFTATMIPLRDAVVGTVRHLLILLLGAVLLVLMIACANVANLLLVRADSLRRELAIRTAMGAERRHLLRQFLLESLILALLGGAAGLAITEGVMRIVPAILPDDLPRPASIEVDWIVLLFTSTVVMLSALLIGVLPALRARGVDVAEILREDGRSSTLGRNRTRFRSSLVIIEIALAVVLSLGAGLLLRSLSALYEVDPGFRPRGVLTMQLSLPSLDYPDDASIVSFYRRLMDETAAIPGVTAAGAVTNLPLGTRLGDLNFTIDGRPKGEGEVSPRADWQAVTPGYFEALGMELIRGRGIEERDDENTAGVIVLNESLAASYWPGRDPLGERLQLGGGAGPGQVTVVGIVRDIRHAGLSEPPRPEMYIPHSQFRFWHGGGAASWMTLALRFEGNPTSLLPAVRSRIAAMDPNLPVANVRTLAEVRSESVARPRFVAALFASFSAVALAMAAIGVYGILAFLVAHRTREIGIRMALGARRGSVLRMVLLESMKLAGPGIALGLAGSIVLARGMAGLLYGVPPLDPITFAGVAVVLLLVATVASAVPALRASRVEPTVALRQD